MDLFVCWANVGRSQIAEGFAKNIGKNVISCASVEARKEKYFYKPEKVITNIILKNYDIDISNQKISYPIDIRNNLEKINNIYFLFDPKKAKKSDIETLIEGKTLWKYLDSIGKKYSIYEIDDPDQRNNKAIISIVDNLNYLIKNIYENTI